MDSDTSLPSRTAKVTSPAPREVKPIETLAGPSGRLEAILNNGDSDPQVCALICHPYPPAGGTMHTKVVYNAMKVISEFGIPVLRFNFRGVGLSAGTFDNGDGEQEDVRAALDWLQARFDRPILLVGFSFGAYVALRAGCADSRVSARISLGLPVRAAGRSYTYEFLRECPGPMLFLSGAEDEFCPAEVLERVVATPSARRRTVLIDGGDHFFQATPSSPGSKISMMQEALRNWIRDEVLRR